THSEPAMYLYDQSENDVPDTPFKHAYAEFQQHEDQSAIHAWKRLIDIAPYYYTVYPELASALNETGQLQEAYEVARKGISYDEFNKELFFIAGQIAMNLGNTTEAMEHMQQAVTLDHDYKEAVLALVELYKQQGMD